MTAIAITTEAGQRQATVERVRLGSDGGAQEMWVRLGSVLKRVPMSAVHVCGSQCVRTLALADFEAAPRV